MRATKIGDRPFSNITDERLPEIFDVEPFKNISAKKKKGIVAQLQRHAAIREFNPGDVIIREGDYGSSAYWILEGDVLICLDRAREYISTENEPVRYLSLR